MVIWGAAKNNNSDKWLEYLKDFLSFQSRVKTVFASPLNPFSEGTHAQRLSVFWLKAASGGNLRRMTLVLTVFWHLVLPVILLSGGEWNDMLCHPIFGVSKDINRGCVASVCWWSYSGRLISSFKLCKGPQSTLVGDQQMAYAIKTRFIGTLFYPWSIWELPQPQTSTLSVKGHEHWSRLESHQKTGQFLQQVNEFLWPKDN